jgi:IS1 family transposase
MASKRIHQLTIGQFEAMFPDEDACKAYLVAHRWLDGVACPRCGNVNVHPHSRPFHWQCTACAEAGGYRFSVLVGTIFENTNIDLLRWFKVIHLMVTSKKGISALQVMRFMGFGSYKTAWYMCHRIRAGMADEDFKKLMGIVEVDETFIGGKAKNRHWDKRGPRGGGGKGGIGSGKAAVAGAVTRKGNVVARVVANVRKETLRQFIREAISNKVSLICTDDNRAYQRMDGEFPHGVVNHAAGQYVVGAIHTNTIEGFWSILKRGVVGTFHKVSPKYLPLYVAEFSFRYNNRLNEDIFGEAIAAC